MEERRKFQSGFKKDFFGKKGSVMVEFVLAFPLYLTLLFTCLQVAHLAVARQIVQYAAFCASRAALVHVTEEHPPSFANDSWPKPSELAYPGLSAVYCRNDSISAGAKGMARSEAEWAACEAASRVCGWITFGYAKSGERDFSVPGWGGIPGSAASKRKTRVRLSAHDLVNGGTLAANIQAEVELDFPVIFPIIGPIMAYGINLLDSKAVQSASDPVDLTRNAYPEEPFPHIRIKGSSWIPKPYRTIIAGRNWIGYK